LRKFIIFAASDGTATTANIVVQAALAQFPEVEVEIKTRAGIADSEDVSQLVQQAAQEQGIIVFTLVSSELRESIIREAREANVAAIDLLGPLLLRFEELFKVAPRGIAGTFKFPHSRDDPRIEAINFTVDHDDGRNPSSLDQADIVIVGVSRTSKTPLSIYLASRGWKVANVPIILGIPPLEILSRIDQRKIVGLTIEAEQLAKIRKSRMEKFNLPTNNSYSDLNAVQKELSYAESVYRADTGWPVVDVTGKSIEEIAQEVIIVLTQRRLGGVKKV